MPAPVYFETSPMDRRLFFLPIKIFSPFLKIAIDSPLGGYCMLIIAQTKANVKGARNVKDF
jgi:hypothetical protein